jgi:predicted O-linked N-acetylglucosamine transferase (SPINDLY family)
MLVVLRPRRSCALSIALHSLARSHACRQATPPDFAEAMYGKSRERLLLLRATYQVNSNARVHTRLATLAASAEARASSRMDVGLPAEPTVVFANFNQPFKADATVLEAWLELLHRTNNTVLWLLAFPDCPSAKPMLDRALAAGSTTQRSLRPDRVVWSAFENDKDAFLRHVTAADLVLDHFAYNAGTTGSDVLFMGTPLLTLPSDKFITRMGASLVLALGLSELCARSVEDYVDLATRLARMPKAVSRWRARVRAAAGDVNSGGLFDLAHWVAGWEGGLRALWDLELAAPRRFHVVRSA